jgi:hypothetical protein
VRPRMEYDVLVTSGWPRSSNDDAQLVEVEEYALLLVGPIGRERRNNSHPPPDPRVRDILLLHRMIVSSTLGRSLFIHELPRSMHSRQPGANLSENALGGLLPNTPPFGTNARKGVGHISYCRPLLPRLA